MKPAPMSPSQITLLMGHHQIRPCHQDRRAIIYVRQSTLHQVRHHTESTRLQYALVDQALALGWTRPQIEVIDEDLGRSASSAEGRPGFQHLVTEVGLNRVGLVLGWEISRFARRCRDWYQLLELCALFGVLIGDRERLCDPTRYSDRLLLGLQGTMSEAELHLIKQRMLQGKLAKARRGELAIPLPRGYLYDPDGQIIKDPDEQVQTTIELIFERFEEIGSIAGLLHVLVAEKIQLPSRRGKGFRHAEVSWQPPYRSALSELLRNPIYAGTYAYGRRPIEPTRHIPGRRGTGRTRLAPHQWKICLHDHHPAYISWTQYERNRQQIQANRPTEVGPLREGPSLLNGLVKCGRCGAKMIVRYVGGAQNRFRYACDFAHTHHGQPRCQSFSGDPLDALISQWVLQALQPAALEVSLQVAADLDAQQARKHQLWEQKLERARYEVERSYRQYNAVEPENRLVSRSLERKWEAALAALEALKEEHRRFEEAEPRTLTDVDREAIRQLAADLPTLWSAPTTTQVDRKAVVRHLIEEIEVRLRGESEQVDVTVRWAGGHLTEGRMIRPVGRYEQLSYYPQLVERIIELHKEGKKPAAIARQINAEGWRPPRRTETFNANRIWALLMQQGIRKHARPPADPNRTEWSIPDLARELRMPIPTLQVWVKKGRVDAFRDETNKRARWLIRADKTERERLREIRRRSGR